MGMSLQLREAYAMNAHQHKPIWEYAKVDGGRVSPYMQGRMEALRSQLAGLVTEAKSSNVNFLDPIYNVISCMHWQIPDFNHSGMWIPLDTKLPAYRGHVTFSPYAANEVYAGISVFHKNHQTGKFEIYMAASQHGRLSDPHGDELGLKPFHPSLVLSPADGENMSVPEVARQKLVSASILKYGLYRFIRSIPEDYNFLFEDPDEFCPPTLWIELDNKIRASKFTVFTKGTETVWDVLNLLTLGTKYTRCATNYLRPDAPKSHGWDFYTVSAGFHGLIEVPGHVVMKVIAGRFWQSINASIV